VTDTICSFFIEGDSLMLKARRIINYNYRSFRGRLLVAFENINGVEEDCYNALLYDTEDTENENGGPVPQYYGFTFNTEDKDKFGQEAICSLKDNTIKAGTYIVTLASQALHEPEISPMRYYKGIKCQAMLVKGENGSVKLSELTPTGIKSTKAAAIRTPSSIYDLHGRKLGTDASMVRKGIYIIDGKLVVR
jgi:hypothetical protein